VGIDTNEAYLRGRLDEFVLSDGEFAQGPDVWQTYADPFPPWGAAQYAHRTERIH
jgi:hypothetical protein